jgi:hypothetical protein
MTRGLGGGDSVSLAPGSGSSGITLGTESAGALGEGLSGGFGLGGWGALAAWADSDPIAGLPVRAIVADAGLAATLETRVRVVAVLAPGLVITG